MKVDELLAKAKDGLETKMVDGEPYPAKLKHRAGTDERP